MYMVRTAVGCKVTKLDLEEIGYEGVYYVKLGLLHKGALMCWGPIQGGEFMDCLGD
jgi:hypothetical protein